MPKIENNFNDLGPKKWLPFQKSFILYHNKNALVRDNLRFFTKPSIEPKPVVNTYGHEPFSTTVQEQCQNLNIHANSSGNKFDFLLVDLTEGQLDPDHLLKWVYRYGKKLKHRKFLWVLVPTDQINVDDFPVAWELSNSIAEFLTRKDEKIICLPNGRTWTSLYFRKDKHSKLVQTSANLVSKPSSDSSSIPNWFILKPKPRNKDEILHPAKYPEDLIKMYVEKFTDEGETVFDPMSGTGTTQVESLSLGRNAYGIELSELFHDIAIKRCRETNTKALNYEIHLGDARHILNFDIPDYDYVVTSPPYWDMLNMKGAEVQATRRSKGLQTNYSDEEKDLGNLDQYEAFVNDLTEVYLKTIKKLKSGGHITIVVKNIKKKGDHYPLAFDLTKRLMDFLKFIHVGFWCQDDLQIAPYGYKHTWVSNTFHHYCLTFKKP